MRGSLYAAFFVSAIAANMSFAQTDMKPPTPKKEPKVLKIHGYEIVDNYAWMRDRGEKKNPEVIKHLEAENAYTEAFMGPNKKFVDDLYKEMLTSASSRPI